MAWSICFVPPQRPRINTNECNRRDFDEEAISVLATDFYPSEIEHLLTDVGHFHTRLAGNADKCHTFIWFDTLSHCALLELLLKLGRPL